MLWATSPDIASPSLITSSSSSWGRRQNRPGRQWVIIGVPFGSRVVTCPVACVTDVGAGSWHDGSVFRGVSRHGHIGMDASLGMVLLLPLSKRFYRAALADGHDKAAASAMAATVGGHSLRAGFVTAAWPALLSRRSWSRRVTRGLKRRGRG